MNEIDWKIALEIFANPHNLLIWISQREGLGRHSLAIDYVSEREVRLLSRSGHVFDTRNDAVDSAREILETVLEHGNELLGHPKNSGGTKIPRTRSISLFDVLTEDMVLQILENLNTQGIADSYTQRRRSG